ncbi:unnamed protein product, partial [Dracunculus medinensis]|uniref:phenylalanine--tRNA ligase n=1 Tax=Dracunculus medinensis TaxID=318479 RepID=A0A0N4U4V0_DRAME
KVSRLNLKTDEFWNISPAIISLLERKLFQQPKNPITLLKDFIVECMQNVIRDEGNSKFLIVSENFDSLLIAKDHVCRSRSDNYYINKDFCLRSHTSAHQYEFLKQGLERFLIIGDVYRRDQIDRTHFPSFHQIEGVCLYSSEQIFNGSNVNFLNHFLFFFLKKTSEKQEHHKIITAKAVTEKLKSALEVLCRHIFGEAIEMRWLDAYFPFTHPSFELEIFYEGEWLEVLGCGVMEQKLLESSNVFNKVGWAFGIGVERLAMVLYDIKDIRLFWTNDSGFLSQFVDKSPSDRFKVRPISVHPQLINDLSFWLPDTVMASQITSDTYDIIRSLGGSLVEQVNLIDSFTNKLGRLSHTYRIVYRSNERALTKNEANIVHKAIERKLVDIYNVEIR